ncbi:MAG: FtsQ-type POTRA domain-containing protein [Oscillospiraceae bacterium]|nr:FtsQ-type POTRA domain-containing protein [Oscillospiraceae bacterium]
MENKSYRPIQQRKRSIWGRLVTFLVICLVLFLGVSVFFRVDEIRVVGETRYTADQIIRASGISQGDHLFLISEQSAVEGIQRALPYVGQAEIRRRFPNRLEIRVSETIPMAIIRLETGYLILDRDARILERTETTPLIRLIELRGLPEPISPREGAALHLGEAGQDRLRYLRDILNVIATLGLSSQISTLDMTELHNPEMLFDGRFTVRLGPNRNLRQKMDMLVSIVATMSDYDAGLIDLGPDQPVFRPNWPNQPEEGYPEYGTEAY